MAKLHLSLGLPDDHRSDFHRRDVVAGYRHFECMCGEEWLSWSRDCDSPSGENCPTCEEWTMAIRAKDDAIARLKKGK